MAQKDFNTIIGQIEEDLKKLQSAKEQVEKVVAENTAFSEKATELIVNTDKLLSILKDNTNDIVNSFATSLTESKQQLEKLINDSKSGISDIHNSIKEEHSKILQSAQTKIQEALNLSALTLKSQKDESQRLTTNFQQTSEDIKTSISEKTEELKKNAKDTLEEQKKENQKTLDQIHETHNQICETHDQIRKTHTKIEQLIGQFLDLKIPETLKNTNEKISVLRKKIDAIEVINQNRFKTSKILHISTLTIVGIFGIVIIMKLFGII